MTKAPDYCKRLIEIDLPIKRISAHARREKSIRHGHISTLHIWWARRPLAACRAVICAALWPDPADPRCPNDVREVMREQMRIWATSHIRLLSADSYKHFEAVARQPKKLADNFVLRNLLLDFIADFSNWDNATVGEYLKTSRVLTQAAHESFGGAPGTLPLVVDPFAGGGSIPLEALRVGADAFAGDVNPVPVLLNKVVLEYIPKFGQRLADEVREWGAWIKREAAKELAEYYPKDADGSTPIAYLWARTVLSEEPTSNELPVQIPLLRTLWLSKRKEFRRALRWVRTPHGKIATEVVEILHQGVVRRVRRPRLEIFTPTSEIQVGAGTVKGGAATCPLSGYTTSAARVKEQLTNQRGGAQSAWLYAVYVAGSGAREFRLAGKADLSAFNRATAAAETARSANPDVFPTEVINPVRPYKNTRGLSAVTRIGCKTFGDLYNYRQSLSIRVFYDVLRRKATAGQASDEFNRAVWTLLAFAVNRAVSQNTSMSRWDASRLTIKGAFSKQALAVVWDFSEANPFSGGSADWDGAIEWVVKFIESNSGLSSPGTATLASATQIPLPSDSAAALITDPPYFAAIPYADLSDFFYVWFRRGLRDAHPELLKYDLTEKQDELIVTNAQRGRDEATKDDSFFRKGMTLALKSARDVTRPDGIGVVVYAEGTTSGWEAIIGAIIDASWIVTSSWPIDTEMENRTQAQGSASLQSSIHIVCRPREDSDGTVRADEVGDWRDVLAELPKRIHEWMPRLAQEGVVGADAIFACLGPALEIFSRYSRVEKSNGEAVTLREYLEQVWAAVAKEALSLVLSSAETSGLEPDGRLTAIWLWTLGGGAAPTTDHDEPPSDDDDETSPASGSSGFALEYDAARKLAQGLGAHLEELEHLVEVKGDVSRLLPVIERTKYLFGRTDAAAPKGKKVPKKAQMSLFVDIEQSAEEEGWGAFGAPKAGNTTLDRIHQSMLLFAAGRGEALKRFLVEEGVGKQGQFWKLAQSLSALYPNGTDEKRWVDGVLARKKSLGFA